MMGATNAQEIDNVVFVIHFLREDRFVWIMFAEDVPYNCDIPLDTVLALIERKKPEWHHETGVKRKHRPGMAFAFSFATE